MNASRPLRADARRNREKLLAVALKAFSANGDAALETIAKEAGVGIGTLYRHFPTREALIEAVYRSELARLCDSARELLGTMPPDEATRAWMDRFLDHLAAKRGIADALKTVIASGGDPYSESREKLIEAMTLLLDAAKEKGVLRGDLDPLDVLATMSGIALSTGIAAGEESERERAGRMMDLLMDGLRYRA
ncbi:TetR/AcrR family transcriptional regulator [Saccharothrix australiensis]|uniref:TetR family transcriptional regulator n=1 Tax=Saccharothrix australiensis TaxID=2072 RepID=A0A495VYB2_9PSEU|nr:TetR/AcrR family transcriptional regulator [Saccharothrix australiensis]RKT54316.1 TetR family transcriptional regulator [Saccharothrix australiensis]